MLFDLGLGVVMSYDFVKIKSVWASGVTAENADH